MASFGSAYQVGFPELTESLTPKGFASFGEMVTKLNPIIFRLHAFSSLTQNNMKTTGKLTYKRYACQECGHEDKKQTNHFGECYSWGSYNACPDCPPYKRPTTWICIEKLPKGWTRPANWKITTLTIEKA